MAITATATGPTMVMGVAGATKKGPIAHPASAAYSGKPGLRSPRPGFDFHAEIAVRFWHLTDVDADAQHVRFQG